MLWFYSRQKFEGRREGRGEKDKEGKRITVSRYCVIPLLVSAGERDLWIDMLCKVRKNEFHEFMCFPGKVDRNAFLKKKQALLVCSSYGLSLMYHVVALERAGPVRESVG